MGKKFSGKKNGSEIKIIPQLSTALTSHPNEIEMSLFLLTFQIKNTIKFSISFDIWWDILNCSVKLIRFYDCIKT